MSDSQRPAPVPDEASQPFFEGAKRHELMIQRCKTCGSHLYPIKLRCDVCLNSDIEWVKASGKGKIYTYAVMHQLYHPGFADEVPYNIAIVELDEGVRCISNVVGCPNSELKVGMRLEVAFADVNDEITVPKFKPA